MTTNGTTRAPAAILIGPPGAGKTTVGGLLAKQLGLGFLDTDASVEAVAGKPVADIFVEDGEPAFRRLEHAVGSPEMAAVFRSPIARKYLSLDHRR